MENIDQKTCRQCGTQLNVAAKYCKSCGTAQVVVEKAQPKANAPSAPKIVQANPQVQPFNPISHAPPSLTQKSSTLKTVAIVLGLIGVLVFISCAGMVILINSAGTHSKPVSTTISWQNAPIIVPPGLDGPLKTDEALSMRLGLYVNQISPAEAKRAGVPPGHGASVYMVFPNDSPAGKYLQVGDLILAADHREIMRDPNIVLAEYILKKKHGDSVVLTVFRNGQKLNFIIPVER